MNELKAGETVQIYSDPVTCEKPEGRALLMELVREDTGDGLSLWYVKFLSDGFKCKRTVNIYMAQRS